MPQLFEKLKNWNEDGTTPKEFSLLFNGFIKILAIITKRPSLTHQTKFGLSDYLFHNLPVPPDDKWNQNDSRQYPR